MGLPVLFGWGKKGKQVGYIGIDKCPNCKNYVHFNLYEYASVFRLYFIPILKWNKKLYLVCSKCDAAWELNGEIKEELIEESLTSPSMEVTTSIWNKVSKIIDDNLEALMKKYPEDFINPMIEMCVVKLCDEVSDIASIRKISLKYLEMLFDEDKAK